MPLNRPTLEQIISRVEGDFKGALGLVTLLRRSFEKAASRALAGVSHVLHGNLQFLSVQVFWDTAQDEFLDRWGSIWGLDRENATFHESILRFTGTPGTLIADASELQRSDGAQYVTDGSGTIPSGVTGVQEISTIQTVADVAGSLDGKTFILGDDNGKVAFWIDINNSGTPRPALADAADRAVEITTILSNDTANSIASKLQAAIDADPLFNASVLTDTVTVTSANTGARDDVEAGDTGFTVATTQQGVDEVIAGQVDINVIASDPGEDSNLDVGDTITLVSPIPGVDSEATVQEIVTEAVASEDNDSYQDRITERVQRPPQGGTAFDYITETKTVSNVDRVWVFPLFLGNGTVVVSFTIDNELDPIPNAAKVAEVQAVLDIFRPVTAIVTAVAPVEVPTDFVIKLKPNSAAVQAAAEAQLKDLFYREAQARGSVNPDDPQEVYDGKILASKINEALSLATGEEDHEIVSPVGNIQPDADGKLLTLGSISWQTLV